MKNNFKLFDSHLHFNMREKDVMGGFFKHISQNKLIGFLLILNTNEEKQFFNKSFLEVFDKKKWKLALLINPTNPDFEFIKIVESNSIPFSIKLHCRLSGIKEQDFVNIYNTLRNISFEHLIIDGFYYGDNLKSHINLELLIFLAKKFPEKKVLFAHAGGHKILETMLYTRNIKNVFYDISLTINYLKNTSVKYDILNFIKYNKEKILFGSDYPDFTINESLRTYWEYSTSLNLSKEDNEKILYKNALDFFELKA